MENFPKRHAARRRSPVRADPMMRLRTGVRNNLPNLQGSAALHPGQGAGLSLYDLGQQGGTETVTLLQTEMPLHTHQAMGLGAIANQPSPANNSWGRSTANPYISMQNRQMSLQGLALTGGSLPHNNLQPYLTLNFCIALQGVFPPRP